MPGQRVLDRGSIPAWAGEPYGPSCGPPRCRVHPRVGGGAYLVDCRAEVIPGPSPRGRGSLARRFRCGTIARSIPAWAGEPVQRREKRDRAVVHPRVGGGAPGRCERGARERGPSPRGRGSQLADREQPQYRGSIPAWAGEPPRHPFAGNPCTVHPRVGGGARLRILSMALSMGPSPRGRGSHKTGPVAIARIRSIPAWAGEPLTAGRTAAASGVHPRVGGGAIHSTGRRGSPDGPSPRGRGSLERCGSDQGSRGSIPAWAGEPSGDTPRHGVAAVHPRVGGGAGDHRSPGSGPKGPSPRGRGSLTTCYVISTASGSIPAWAGEPCLAARSSPAAGVHPRVGGGAWVPDQATLNAPGPSPRGRGSHAADLPNRDLVRSIPAWAGEPAEQIGWCRGYRVHPRVGGGADDPWGLLDSPVGPSPRGRGSRARPTRASA